MLISSCSAKPLESDLPAPLTFRAKPVDRRVLESAGDIGVPKLDRKAVTTPRPFSFVGETRHQQEKQRIQKLQEQRKEEDENIPQFKALAYKPYVSCLWVVFRALRTRC
jgi:hypothetical protein